VLARRNPVTRSDHRVPNNRGITTCDITICESAGSLAAEYCYCLPRRCRNARCAYRFLPPLPVPRENDLQDVATIRARLASYRERAIESGTPTKYVDTETIQHALFGRCQTRHLSRSRLLRLPIARIPRMLRHGGLKPLTFSAREDCEIGAR